MVIDCSSYIANDILSAVALMEADSVLQLASCDRNRSDTSPASLPLLGELKWDKDKQYRVASNIKPFQAADRIGQVLGSVVFRLPYSQELEEQYLAGELLADLSMKDSRAFRKEIDRICEEVILVAGERRNNSLFAPAAPAEPERKPEQAEVHDISFEERTGRSLFAETATAPRASELFFAPQEKGITFAEALSQVQGYLSETYATLITEDNSDAKEQMKRRMTRYLQENRIAVDGMTASELVDACTRKWRSTDF